MTTRTMMIPDYTVNKVHHNDEIASMVEVKRTPSNGVERSAHAQLRVAVSLDEVVVASWSQLSLTPISKHMPQHGRRWVSQLLALDTPHNALKLNAPCTTSTKVVLCAVFIYNMCLH